MAAVRNGAWVVLKYVTSLFFVGVIVQFFLVGYGLFAMKHGATIDDAKSLDPHRGFGGRTLLLLHHTGAKTGTERINPLAYQRLSDNSVAIFASKGGAPKTPDWFYNLVAHPDVKVEIGTETFSAHARVAEGAERET